MNLTEDKEKLRFLSIYATKKYQQYLFDKRDISHDKISQFSEEIKAFEAIEPMEAVEAVEAVEVNGVTEIRKSLPAIV